MWQRDVIDVYSWLVSALFAFAVTILTTISLATLCFPFHTRSSVHFRACVRAFCMQMAECRPHHINFDSKKHVVNVFYPTPTINIPSLAVELLYPRCFAQSHCSAGIFMVLWDKKTPETGVYAGRLIARTSEPGTSRWETFLVGTEVALLWCVKLTVGSRAR